MYDAKSELSVKGYLDKVSYSKFNLINIYPQYDGTANELYLIISEWEKIVLYKFQNSDWKQIATLSDTNGLNNYKVYNNELYISKVDYNGKNVGLFKLENGSFKNLGTYYSGSSFNEYAGSPNVEIINGTIYAIIIKILEILAQAIKIIQIML